MRLFPKVDEKRNKTGFFNIVGAIGVIEGWDFNRIERIRRPIEWRLGFFNGGHWDSTPGSQKLVWPPRITFKRDEIFNRFFFQALDVRRV